MYDSFCPFFTVMIYLSFCHGVEDGETKLCSLSVYVVSSIYFEEIAVFGFIFVF